MRILTSLAGSLLGVALTLAHPPAASAEGDQNWQTCVGTATAPNERVTACGAVIDALKETGKRLAAAYCLRGHGLTEKRELDGALSDINESIRLDPGSACAFTNRGRVHSLKREFDRAIADYGAAAKIAPTDARGWRNRGMIRLYQGDTKRGIADYDKALQHDPADAYSWNNRGQAKVRIGDKAGATADFRKALEINPSLRTARDGLQQLGAAQ